MNQDLIDNVTKAVLYEGYLLYPYRKSAVKNRHRWTFGALYPQAYVHANPNDSCLMQTECIVHGSAESLLSMRLRFLHLSEVVRPSRPQISEEQSGKSAGETPAPPPPPQGIQEAVERDVLFPTDALKNLIKSKSYPVSYPWILKTERDTQVRQEAIQGHVEIKSEQIAESVFKISLRIVNDTTLEGSLDRDEALMRSFVSTHSVLHVREGAFVSLIDPQEQFREAVAGCRNIGNWPVLVGEQDSKDAMLASPIILYDYPQVAPESAGDLFDSTEIDEILTLRILTLTDQEKEEIRNTDERARNLLERTESIPQEQFLKLHGAVRGLKRVIEHESAGETPAPPLEGATELAPWDPWESKPAVESVRAFGVEIKKGDRVRLWPVKSADIMDLALSGRTAIIESIEEDYDGIVHLAVVVEDDPGKDLGEMRQPGHRFFFTADEVEPI